MRRFPLFAYLTAWAPTAYGVVFLGMIVEGEATLFAAGALVSQGVLNIFILIPLAIIGVLIGDAGWFEIGRMLARRTGRLANAVEHWSERIAAPFDKVLTERTFHTILVSKFTYGFHHALLIRGGYIGMSYAQFRRADIFSTLLWVPVITTLGYCSGGALAWVVQAFRSAEHAIFVILIWFVSLVLLWRFLGSVVRWGLRQP